MEGKRRTELGRITIESSIKGTDCFQNFTRMPTDKRPLGRPRRRWEDNDSMDLKEIAINTRNWVHSIPDRDY